MITGEQASVARHLLGWSLIRLKSCCGVSDVTIQNFEQVEELRSVVTFPNKLQRTFRAPTTAKTESLVQTNRWKRRRTPTGLLADRTTMLIDFDDTPTEVVSRSFAVAKFDSQGVP